jgi:AcrR family transcriptional regulator
MRRPSAETREHVLRIARDLFYDHGIRATGVDRVAAAAGVAPTTLYRAFASKDDLVAAYLAREAAAYREWFAAAADGDRPRDRVLSLFDALVAQVRAPDCRGCPFQIGVAELADPGLAGHGVAAEVKRWTRERLGELVDGDNALADELMLVLEGVYASVLTLGHDGPVLRARALVERLLD